MALVQEFGYVVYGVPDLDGSVEFFRRIMQLEVSEKRDGVVFLTGDTKHAWLRLEQASAPGLKRLGFRVVDPAALDEVKNRLEKAGVAWTAGGTVKEDRIDNAIRFTTDSIEVELYEEQVVLGASPAPERGIVCALHTVVSVPDVVAAREFWKSTMDFHRSDQIEDIIVFLRCGNGYHHSLGLARGEAGKLDHVCFLVDDIDTVVKFRNHARANDIPTEDLVKHTASGSVSIYLETPPALGGLGVEICAGHMVITDDEYNGRLLKAGPITADQWSAGFPDVTPAGAVFGRGGGTAAGSLASHVD